MPRKILTMAVITEPSIYAAAVAWCVENHLMNGVGNSRFDPTGTLDRRTLATVLYRNAGEPSVSAVNHFSDIQNGQWYTNAVIWASKQRLITGYSGSIFGAGDPVTKVQLNVIFQRYRGENPAWPGDPAKTSATRADVAVVLYENLNGAEGQGLPSAPVISEVTSLEAGFSSAEFSGDDGFASFLAQGGADSDRKVAGFLSERLNTDVTVNGTPFGCSAFVVKNLDGGATF